MFSFFNNKIDVTIFTLEVSYNNEKSIDDFVKEFGNIPRYLELESDCDNFNQCIYLFCIDSLINYREIIAKYGYIYYHYNYKTKVDKYLYNDKYQITINYSKNKEPYKLVKVI